jgi:hypothetical protein
MERAGGWEEAYERQKREERLSIFSSCVTDLIKFLPADPLGSITVKAVH